MNNNGISLAILILLILGFFGLFLSFLVNILFTPFYTTPKTIIEEILKIINLQDGDLFVDLGSGDGRMVIKAAQNKKVSAIGYELSPFLVVISRILKFLTVGFRKNIIFELQNIFSINFTPNSVVYTYLEPRALERLYTKIRNYNDLKLYTYEYKIPGVKPTKTYHLSNNKDLFYYYINSKNCNDENTRKRRTNKQSPKQKRRRNPAI